MTLERGVLESICRLVMELSMRKRRGLHTMTLRRIKRLLETMGWSVILEFETYFDTVIRYRKKLSRVRGFIDLLARKGERQVIAVVFDNTNVLKYRSIEKLLQHPGMVIGMTAGRYGVDNRARIERVMRERGQWRCSEFWLIEVGQERI